jgi:DNA polymerase III epsilon subunit-like protein
MPDRPPKFLFFDCETTGLPRSRHFSVETVDDWPHLVQIAWARYDVRGNLEDAHAHIVRPAGFRIPAEAAKIHGITHAHARRVGKDLETVLDEFLEALSLPETTLVAHNLDYDRHVVMAELVRTKRSLGIVELPGICTMKETTELCQLSRAGGFGYKWPTLDELHNYCFGFSYEGAHDAARDLEACARSYFKLLEAGHFRIPAR